MIENIILLDGIGSSKIRLTMKVLTKKRFIYLGSFILLLCMGIWGKPYLMPYYNARFTHYDYKYPTPDQDFIVGIEPYDYSPPPFLLNLLKIAFNDRNVIFSNDKQPHFIIRSEHISANASASPEYQKWNAPYISISAERWTLSQKRYRQNGLPLAELVSTTPQKSRELYFPFVLWCGLKPERVYSDGNRKKLLAYIASNCIKQREKLFALIHNQDNSAEALGRCSNTSNQKIPMGWGALDVVYADYNFGFAMENHQVPGYITEKIITVFRGGSIPIYWGDSATVKKYFNPKAFVDVGSFENLEKAAEYIIALNQDKKRLENMRQEPLFLDKETSELFNINTDPHHPLLKDAADFIRKKYFKILDKNID